MNIDKIMILIGDGLELAADGRRDAVLMKEFDEESASIQDVQILFRSEVESDFVLPLRGVPYMGNVSAREIVSFEVVG